MMAELCNFNPGHGFIVLLQIISLPAIWQRIILLQLKTPILCRDGKAGFSLIWMTVEISRFRFRVQSYTPHIHASPQQTYAQGNNHLLHQLNHQGYCLGQSYPDIGCAALF